MNAREAKIIALELAVGVLDGIYPAESLENEYPDDAIRKIEQELEKIQDSLTKRLQRLKGLN